MNVAFEILARAKAWLCWDRFPELSIQLVETREAVAYYYPPSDRHTIVLYYETGCRDFSRPLFLLFHEAGHHLQCLENSDDFISSLDCEGSHLEKEAWRRGKTLFREFLNEDAPVEPARQKTLINTFSAYSKESLATYQSQKSQSPSILALDFDGVLCNSLLDSMITALNAYVAVNPRHSLPLSAPVAPEKMAEFPGQYPDIYRAFEALMPLGHLAEDYFVFFKLMESGQADAIQSQQAFNQFKATLPEDDIQNFSRQFYADREALQSQNADAWARMMRPFDFIPPALTRLSQRFVCAMATAKDLRSVSILLKEWGMEHLFHPDDILHKDLSPAKRDLLIRLQKRHNVPYSRIHFIDDKVSHLEKVIDLGVQCYLSAWGFNSPREHDQARALGARVLYPEDFRRLHP